MKKRIVCVALALFFLFSLLIAHYFKIQILESEKWTKQALSQHECLIKEPFKRGTFFANNSVQRGHPQDPQPLVFDVTLYHLYIDPQSIPEYHKKEAAKGVVEFFPSLKELEKEFDVKSRSRCLARWIDKEKKESILKWWTPFAKEKKIACNALYFVTDYKRSYPYGPLLGQVLHTIREKKDESTAEGLPTGGLESYFNEYLKGRQGKRKLLRSPLHQIETDNVIVPPEDGCDLYLTINHFIQAIAEEELAKGVEAAQAKRAWAIMMDPFTGEILALAHTPPFDPHNYRDYFNDPERIEDARTKAISDAFEIGSIMKPITLAVGLKANEELKKQGKPPLFDPLEPIDTTRSLFPGRASHPLWDRPPHRALNMYMALQRSSNVYMAQLIDRVVIQMGNGWYRKQLVDTFGFGKKTGIELPGEAKGHVPTPGKCYPNGALEWSLPTPYSLSFGYNLLATSLQMARAYAVFLNGGYLPTPTLVRKIAGKDKIVLDHEKNKESFPQVLDPSITEEIMKCLKYTTKIGGTGTLADIAGYTEGGKSGTAEKIIHGVYSKKTHISSFIGFAPASLKKSAPPRFVLIVSVDEPEYRVVNGLKYHMGGRCAAPIFREIARRTLEYMGVEEDDPYGRPYGDSRRDLKQADWMEEVKALKTLYDTWNETKKADLSFTR